MISSLEIGFLIVLLIFLFFWVVGGCLGWLIRCTNCHEVGYAPRRHSKTPVSSKKESKTSDKDKSNVHQILKGGECSSFKMEYISEFDKRLQEESASEDRSCHEASPAIDESQRGPGSHGSSPHGTRNILSKVYFH